MSSWSVGAPTMTTARFVQLVRHMSNCGATALAASRAVVIASDPRTYEQNSQPEPLRHFAGSRDVAMTTRGFAMPSFVRSPGLSVAACPSRIWVRNPYVSVTARGPGGPLERGSRLK